MSLEKTTCCNTGITCMDNDCFICEQKTKQKAGTNVLCTVLDEDINHLIVTS
jgi:hypothetical protein